MGISAGQFLRDFISWHWLAHFFFMGYGYLVLDTVYWYRALPDPTTQQTFLVSTVVGMAPLVLNFYMALMQRLPGKS